MIIVGFSEGAIPRKGGLGLVGVPPMLANTAARGHKVILVMPAPANPNCADAVVSDADLILHQQEGRGTFGVVTFSAWTPWGFSPTIFWRFSRLVRSADFISLHSPYSFPVLAGYLMARFHRKPYGVWPLGALAPFQRLVSAKKKWLYERLVLRPMLKRASVLLFTATGERDEISDMKLLTPSVIIPHGLDVDEFKDLPPRGSFRAKFLGGHTGPLVLYIGRLNAKKGLDLLIKAMPTVLRQVPHAKLAIAGPADPEPFGAEVRRWIKESGLENDVVLTGAIRPDTRREALADADVFAMPSYAENFCFAVFEAMASRVPVVVSDTLNYSAEIASRGAGLSVNRTAEGIAAAISELLQNPELARTMGHRGLELARSYSWDEAALKIEKTIAHVTENSPLPYDLTCEERV